GSPLRVMCRRLRGTYISCMRRNSIALALLLGVANALSAERIHDTERDLQSALRHYLVAHMRIAAADRLIEQPEEIAAYINARFNTLALYDAEPSSGLPKSEERIAYELEFARA